MMKYSKPLVILALGFALSGTMAEAQDSLTPKEHFKIERPAQLKSTDANSIYDSIIRKMAAGYAQSGNETAKDYRNWKKENNAPYLSNGHGNRFLNNYSNKLAEGYLKFLPVHCSLWKKCLLVPALTPEIGAM